MTEGAKSDKVIASQNDSFANRSKGEMCKEILPAYYISGLVDGEGCFALNFRRDKRHERKGKPEYFYWTIRFIIVLRIDDKTLLEKVRDTLDCGVDILYHNRQSHIQKGQRGFPKMQWESSDIQHLLEITKEMEGYKSKGSAWKWVNHLGGDCELR